MVVGFFSFWSFPLFKRVVRYTPESDGKHETHLVCLLVRISGKGTDGCIN